MDQTRPATLIEAVKTFWRNFAFAWVFPIVFLYGGLAADELGQPLLFFWLVATPLFFWSFFLASRPWLQQKIRYWHCVFWGMAVPFIIWMVAVFSRLAVIKLIGQ